MSLPPSVTPNTRLFRLRSLGRQLAPPPPPDPSGQLPGVVSSHRSVVVVPLVLSLRFPTGSLPIPCPSVPTPCPSLPITRPSLLIPRPLPYKLCCPAFCFFHAFPPFSLARPPPPPFQTQLRSCACFAPCFFFLSFQSLLRGIPFRSLHSLFSPFIFRFFISLLTHPAPFPLSSSRLHSSICYYFASPSALY